MYKEDKNQDSLMDPFDSQTVMLSWIHNVLIAQTVC